MTNALPTKNEQFTDLIHKLTTAVVGEQMAKNGVIGAYPEKFTKEIKEVKAEIVDFMSVNGLSTEAK